MSFAGLIKSGKCCNDLHWQANCLKGEYICAVCHCHSVFASRETPTVFWQQADKPAFADNVLLAKHFLQWQTLRGKGALLSQSDHSGDLFSTVITTSANLSSPRAPESSILRPRRLSVVLPRSWGLGMELAGCKAAGSCGGPTAATAERQGRMRRALAARRALSWAGSQGWAAKCRFSFFWCYRHYGIYVSEVSGCCYEAAAHEWVVRSFVPRVPVPMLSSFWAVVGPSPAHSPACLHVYGTRCSIIFCPSEQIWDPGQHLPLTGVAREPELGRALAGAVLVAEKGGRAVLPCWEGDLGWLVQWGLCCQHWAAAVKVPAVTLRRVSSVHVIDDFEMWQIYWCPESLQPLRVFIVYLIISRVAKTDVAAANNRERNGANDEHNNTLPHWSKAAAMHCRTIFFFPKGPNTCFLYIAGFADALLKNWSLLLPRF